MGKCTGVALVFAFAFGLLLSGALLPSNEWEAVKEIHASAVFDPSVTAVECNQWNAEKEKEWQRDRIITVGDGDVFGPESLVQSDSNQEIYYAGTADGLLLRIRIPCEVLENNRGIDIAHTLSDEEERNGNEEGERMGEEVMVTVVAHVGGRPLGVLEVNEEEILVMEAASGRMLKVNVIQGTAVSLVTTSGPGLPLTYPNDMDIDRENGYVYFSDSTAVKPIFDKSSGLWSTMRAAQLDILSGTPTGRLFRHSLAEGVTELLVKDIAYANGVALAPDRSFVLVCETGRYRVLRHWLTGERAGETEVFFAVPGSPDGISRDRDGSFWLAVILPRSKIIPFIQQYPWLQSLALRIPGYLWPLPQPAGLAIQLDADGNVLQVLNDPTGTAVHSISAVNAATCNSSRYLLLGGLERRHILAYAL